MPQSHYRAREVGAKTKEVVAYDHDPSLPGKPLHILIPGGLVALAALAVIIYVAYLTWFQGELDQTTAVITRGVRGGVITVSSATAGISRGLSTFLGGEKRPEREE